VFSTPKRRNKPRISRLAGARCSGVVPFSEIQGSMSNIAVNTSRAQTLMDDPVAR
jgi:hypothetical protein